MSKLNNNQIKEINLEDNLDYNQDYKEELESCTQSNKKHPNLFKSTLNEIQYKLENATINELEKFYLTYMISCAIIGLPIAMWIYSLGQ